MKMNSQSIIIAVMAMFIAWKILLYAVVWVARDVVPAGSMLKYFNPDYKFNTHTPDWLWVWKNFDGTYYDGIARRGYFRGEEPFFPLYPLLIRVVHDLSNYRYLVSAQIISNLSLVAALVVALKLLRLDGLGKYIHTFFLMLFLYPTSFFYSAIYNDGLFFFLATLTLYWLRSRRFILAGLSGFLATLARLNGLALIFPFLIEYISPTGPGYTTGSLWKFKELRLRMGRLLDGRKLFRESVWAVLAIPAAFLLFLGYIQIRFASWTNVFTSMKLWGQDQVVLPIQVFWRYAKITVLTPTRGFTWWVALGELFFVILYFWAMIWAFKKIRLSYWLFLLISILIPSFTGTFQGMPRYGLHLYPFFLALTLWFVSIPAWLKIVYVALSLVGLVVLLSLFTRGYFVA